MSENPRGDPGRVPVKTSDLLSVSVLENHRGVGVSAVVYANKSEPSRTILSLRQRCISGASGRHDISIIAVGSKKAASHGGRCGIEKRTTRWIETRTSGSNNAEENHPLDRDTYKWIKQREGIYNIAYAFIFVFIRGSYALSRLEMLDSP